MPVRTRLLLVAIRIALITLLVGLLVAVVAWRRVGSDRVIKVRATYPTATKPQAKLWHAHGRWWAWLPDGKGSSVWTRGDAGWQRVSALDDALAEAAGYADVWADGDGVTAVLSSPQQITVARLAFDELSTTYKPLGPLAIWRHDNLAPQQPTECATIARDRDGRFWIAYDHGGIVWVRASRDAEARDWEAPVAISEKFNGDDLSAVFPLLDGVGVVWTDQSRDAIYFRRHALDKPHDAWQGIEVVEQGGGVANNHLSAAVAHDGTLYVASKRNRYEVGKPLLLLRVRGADGVWKSVSLANYSKAITPTRPIALLDPDEQRLHIAYTALDNSAWNQHAIIGLVVDRRQLAVAPAAAPFIAPHFDLQSAASCKGYLPAGVPWIVLASDRWGNVYEGVFPPALSAAE